MGTIGPKSEPKPGRYAGVKARRTNKIQNHRWSDSIYNPVEVQLQYLPTLYLGTSVASRPASLTEESRNLALPVRFEDFSRFAGASLEQGRSCTTKIANIRKGFVHKSSNDLSKNYTVAFVEDLSIRNVSKSGVN